MFRWLPRSIWEQRTTNIEEFIALSKQMKAPEFQITAKQVVEPPGGSAGGILQIRHLFSYTARTYKYGEVKETLIFLEVGEHFHSTNGQQEKEASIRLYETGTQKARELLSRLGTGSVKLYLEEYRDMGKVEFYHGRKEPLFR